jgi:hypothetical protein
MKRFLKHKNWYRQTRGLLIKKYGKDYKLFAGLLASTSPRFQVKRNYNTALKIYQAYLIRPAEFLAYAVANKKEFIKYHKLLPAHYNNIIRSLSHSYTRGKKLELSGLKVNSFYNNIIGNYNFVTIDIWMLRYFKHPKNTLGVREYRYYTRIVRKLAKKVGLLPAELQAVLWEKQRNVDNKAPSNFYRLIKAL